MAAGGLGVHPLFRRGGLLTTGVSSELTGVSSELAGVSSELQNYYKLQKSPSVDIQNTLVQSHLATKVDPIGIS